MHFNYLLLGSATLLQLAFLGESDANFTWKTFALGHKNRQNTNTKKYKHDDSWPAVTMTRPGVVDMTACDQNRTQIVNMTACDQNMTQIVDLTACGQ